MLWTRNLEETCQLRGTATGSVLPARAHQADPPTSPILLHKALYSSDMSVHGRPALEMLRVKGDRDKTNAAHAP